MQHTVKYYQTAAGIMHLTIEDNAIIKAEFVERAPAKELIEPAINIQIKMSGTDFQIKVWRATQEIPAGKTVTYKELAHTIGHPRSWRAVANALGDNKIAYFIPCHRVVRSNGSLAGYRWGVERKKALLEAEGIKV